MGWKERVAVKMLEAGNEAPAPPAVDYTGLKNGREPLFPLAGQIEWPLPARCLAEREPVVTEAGLERAGEMLQEFWDVCSEIAWDPQTYAPLAAGGAWQPEAAPAGSLVLADERTIYGWPEYPA